MLDITTNTIHCAEIVFITNRIYIDKMNPSTIHESQSTLSLISNTKVYQKKVYVHTKTPGQKYYSSGVSFLFCQNKQCVIKHLNKYSEEKERFADNSIDIFNTSLPFNDIDEIIVFPEEGEWYLEKIVIKDMCYQSIQTYPCNELIGTSSVPATLLSKEKNKFSLINFEQNMKEYDDMKKSILKTQFGLIVIGCLSSIPFNGSINVSQSYLLGSILGLIYTVMLQKETDLIASSNSSILLLPLFSSASRLLLITCFSIHFIHMGDISLLAYFIGFQSYKLAVIIDYMEINK